MLALARKSRRGRKLQFSEVQPEIFDRKDYWCSKFQRCSQVSPTLFSAQTRICIFGQKISDSKKFRVNNNIALLPPPRRYCTWAVWLVGRAYFTNCFGIHHRVGKTVSLGAGFLSGVGHIYRRNVGQVICYKFMTNILHIVPSTFLRDFYGTNAFNG